MNCLITHTQKKKQAKDGTITTIEDEVLELTSEEIINMVVNKKQCIVVEQSTKEGIELEIEIVNL